MTSFSAVISCWAQSPKITFGNNCRRGFHRLHVLSIIQQVVSTVKALKRVQGTHYNQRNHPLNSMSLHLPNDSWQEKCCSQTIWLSANQITANVLKQINATLHSWEDENSNTVMTTAVLTICASLTIIHIFQFQWFRLLEFCIWY